MNLMLRFNRVPAGALVCCGHYLKTHFIYNSHFQCRFASSSSKKSPVIPKNVLESVQTGHLQPDNGAIFDKKPFKLSLNEGKLYLYSIFVLYKN